MGNASYQPKKFAVIGAGPVGAIVAAYQKKGVKVTLEQVKKANPNLKPKQLHVGQKLFIPDPALP